MNILCCEECLKKSSLRDFMSGYTELNELNYGTSGIVIEVINPDANAKDTKLWMKVPFRAERCKGRSSLKLPSI